jgi:hypothetical protein
MAGDGPVTLEGRSARLNAGMDRELQLARVFF